MSTLPASPNHAGAQPRPALRVGLGSYAFRWNVELAHLNARDLLRLASQMGAQVVQLQDNLPLESMPAENLRGLAEDAASLGLELEAGIRGSRPEQLRWGLWMARELGAPLLRVVLSTRDWSPTTGELQGILADLLPELRSSGVLLALENHFDLHPRELAALVETIHDPQVGVCLDPLNAVSQLASQQETIRLLAPHALCVHVKDVKVERLRTGFYVRGCPLGDGLADLPFLLGALRQAGRAPALLLEAWMDRLEDDSRTCAQEEAWIKSGLKTIYRWIHHEENEQ